MLAVTAAVVGWLLFSWVEMMNICWFYLWSSNKCKVDTTSHACAESRNSFMNYFEVRFFCVKECRMYLVVWHTRRLKKRVSVLKNFVVFQQICYERRQTTTSKFLSQNTEVLSKMTVDENSLPFDFTHPNSACCSRTSPPSQPSYPNNSSTCRKEG
jgi:hypothetical protein